MFKKKFESDNDYITKYLTPDAISSIMYIPKLKTGTSKGPIVPIKVSKDSVVVLRRESLEKPIKKADMRPCKFTNESDCNIRKSTSLTHLSAMHTDNLKNETSNGHIVYSKNSKDSVVILKRESQREKLKQVEFKRSKSVNELDEC